MSDATYQIVGCHFVPRVADRARFTVRITREDPKSWDFFAQACGATFRGAYWGAFAWQFRHHFTFVLKRYDICANGSDGSAKIGQFVIGIGRRKRVFGDVLHLLPAYQASWQIIMANILSELGPAIYHYGSDWTTEPSRTESIRRVKGAKILLERPIDVYAIKFGDFASWDDLYKGLSSNVRRNIASASRSNTAVLTSEKTRYILALSCALLFFKRRMFSRKGLGFSLIRAYAVLLSRVLSIREYMFLARAVKDGRTVSIFSGLRFGQDLYYLEGASVNLPGGAAWLLLISMLKDNYKMSRGLGTCILGPDEKEDRNPIAQAAWQNLLRQRLQCRARPYPTSLVTFRYTGDRSTNNGTEALHQRAGLFRVGERRLKPIN